MIDNNNLSYYNPPSSEKMTKKWRMHQNWYKTGKSSECEIFQRDNVESITGEDCPKTNMRINRRTLDFKEQSNIYNIPNGYDWTEDFDGKQIFAGVLKLFYNFKMVCDAGGAQTRSLREVYHFIETQLKLLLKFSENKKELPFFVNILDGDVSYKNMDKFKYVLNLPEYKHVKDRIYIDDLSKFREWFTNLKSSYIEIMKKHQQGQFYTTNTKKILNKMDMKYFKKNTIVEPFVGNGDLIKWMIDNDGKVKKMQIFDIDPKEPVRIFFPNIKDLEEIKRDTLLNPPDYKNKIVVTNPPYLAKNKAKTKENKELFKKHKDCSDLFRIFIKQFIDGDGYGGIFIVPLNFFSAQKKNDVKLRRKFLLKYQILKLNIFEEQVFDDTTTTVCCFKFKKYKDIPQDDTRKVEGIFYPSREKIKMKLNDENNWLHGGEILKLGDKGKKFFKVKRLEDKHKKKDGDLYEKDGFILTSIYGNLLDSGSEDGKLRLEYKEEPYYGINTDRSKLTILIKVLENENKEEFTKKIKSNEFQKEIINEFNKILNEYREKYRSMFLANYRESKGGDARKKCSFEVCFGLISHILNKKLKIQN